MYVLESSHVNIFILPNAQPNLRHTRKYGSAAFVQILKAKREGKLSTIAWRGVLVGYSITSPEWLILDPNTARVRSAYSVQCKQDEKGIQKQQKPATRPFATHGTGGQWTQVSNYRDLMVHEASRPEETWPTTEPTLLLFPLTLLALLSPLLAVLVLLTLFTALDFLPGTLVPLARASALRWGGGREPFRLVHVTSCNI